MNDKTAPDQIEISIESVAIEGYEGASRQAISTHLIAELEAVIHDVACNKTVGLGNGLDRPSGVDARHDTNLQEFCREVAFKLLNVLHSEHESVFWQTQSKGRDVCIPEPPERND